MLVNNERAIRMVKEGFHRHDKLPGDVDGLDDGGAPAVGQAVKVLLNLHRPMPSATEPDSEVDFLALTGEVVEVVDEDCVVAEVVATTSLHPADFGGEWLVELCREDGWEFPWKLTVLTPADPAPSFVIGYEEVDGLGFRVAWLNSAATNHLGQLSDSVGGPSEPTEFVPMSVPFGNGSTVIWSVAAGPEASALERELLVRCSDAVIVDVEPEEWVEQLLEDIPEEPAVIRWDQAIAPDPMAPLKLALKQMLLELRESSVAEEA